MPAKSRPSTPEPFASPWGPARGREQQRALKREAVLRAAARLFNEKGYAASTLDEVAERLGVSKPTIYYYAESKDAILLDCVRIGLEMLQTAIRAVDAKGGRAIDKLIAAMRQYAEIATLDFGMCVIRVGEESLPPESRRKVRLMKAGLDREFRALIVLGIEEGSIAPCDPKLAAFTLAGALSWIARWYRPDGPLAPEVIAEQCIRVLLLGLCSDTARAAASAPREARAAAEPPPPARKRASRPRGRG
jgi:AcrR family transcriptional regulator